MELLSAIDELLESDIIIFWSVIEAFFRSLLFLANIEFYGGLNYVYVIVYKLSTDGARSTSE